MFSCEFCKSTLSSKSAIILHQKRAKYCIEIQKGLNVKVGVLEQQCEFCQKNFIRKDLKTVHEKICKNKKDDRDLLIDEYKLKIKNLEYELNEVKTDLAITKAVMKSEIKVESVQKEIYEKLHTKVENCVEKIALQPKTSTSSSSNTNILNNMPCFTTTVEELKLEAQKSFSEELFLQGQAGAAKFFLDYSKNKNGGVVPWVVTDKSRGTLKLKNANNEIVTDSKAIMLSKLVSDSIKEKNLEYYDTTYMVSDNKDYEDEDTNDSDDDGYKETENDIRDEKIQNGYMEIKRMTRDNTIFRKKLIEGS